MARAGWRRLLAGASWLFVYALAFGCGGPSGAELVTVRWRADGVPLSAAALRFAPPVRSARLGADGWLAIEREPGAGAITLSVPGFCPLTVPAGPQKQDLTLRPVIEPGGDRPPLGFDAPFTIVVTHGCPERGQGHITWRQLSGPALHDLTASADGFRLSARTASLAELHPEPLPMGIVPFSPRNQGRVVLEARWERAGEPAVVRTLSLTATSRASGLSSVAVSQQLVLGAADYRLRSAPAASHAETFASGSVSLFTPDVPGRWVLERAGGETLHLQSLQHDRTPYDCGRSECHAALARSTADSPMSHALERQLEAPTGSAAVGCMLDCHVLGERGLQDGGFLATARELGFGAIDGLRWYELPRALRRAGGVRCTGCHGPGAIPPPEARDAILRADVCASCHDAPPRYVHVTQWRSSRMARADADPRTRAGACASCHTTSGFLAAIGARTAHAGQSTDEVMGISCAACHAPHAEPRGPKLLRKLAPDGDTVTALCVRCHAGPTADAPSGPLALGRVRVPLADGRGWQEISRPAGHAALPRGCVGCHGAQPGAAGGRVDHAFGVDPASCSVCHRDRSPSELRAIDVALQAEAEALWRKLAGGCALPDVPTRPAHARPPGSPCRTPAQARALFEISLVLDDPAAAQHNAALARELLRDAAAQLASQ